MRFEVISVASIARRRIYNPLAGHDSLLPGSLLQHGDLTWSATRLGLVIGNDGHDVGIVWSTWQHRAVVEV